MYYLKYTFKQYDFEIEYLIKYALIQIYFLTAHYILISVLL